MFRGLWRLTWLEMKIFVREPLGLIGTVVLPVVLFALLGRLARPGGEGVPRFASDDLPVFASLLMAVSAVLSLIAIVAIYRESGILKRLRATPLRPHTILTAHVLSKLAFTAVTLVLMVVVGRRYYSVPDRVPLLSFTIALLFSTLSLLSIGFVVASLVRTARFAQPVGTLVFYPMLGLSGLFAPLESLPPLLRAVARVLPLTATTSLLRGVWQGEGRMAHVADVALLVVTFVVCIAVSARVFRWK
jgi:ABC-2 type transport system permease protein